MGKARMEFSAGGVVYRRTNNGEIEVAFIRYEKGGWTFPKGHIEPGESNEVAAARESREELGLKELVEKDFLGTIDLLFKDKYNTPGAMIQKRIYYFLFETKEMETSAPQEDYIKEVRWVQLAEAANFLEHKNMQKILNQAIVILKENRI